MLDFDTILDKPSTTATTVVMDVPVIEEKVVVRPPRASEQRGYLVKPDDQWDWSDLRDYVFAKMDLHHGPQVRDYKKEASIFRSFMTRWPDNAVAIARFAFEEQRGIWHSAPISANRFCKASDQYFGAVIAARL